MKKRILLLCSGLFFVPCLAASPLHAQMPIPIGPGDGDGNTTPIGGIAVLAALGVGYAIKKLRSGKRQT